MNPTVCELSAVATLPESWGLEHLKAESPDLTCFERLPDGNYHLTITFTQSDSPEVADGDLHDDLREMFEELVALQRLFGCKFELKIAVGGRHPNPFVLPERVVIALAILQCRIEIQAES